MLLRLTSISQTCWLRKAPQQPPTSSHRLQLAPKDSPRQAPKRPQTPTSSHRLQLAPKDVNRPQETSPTGPRKLPSKHQNRYSQTVRKRLPQAPTSSRTLPQPAQACHPGRLSSRICTEGLPLGETQFIPMRPSQTPVLGPVALAESTSNR